MKILVDNAAAPGPLAEHGFSLWVEADNNKILFDTGQGPALLHNAQAMHVDLGKTELLILSHGHYDHTGGLHLLNAQEEQLHKVVSELKQFDISKIIACHCTGDRAYSHLTAEFACIKGHAGMEISI